MARAKHSHLWRYSTRRSHDSIWWLRLEACAVRMEPGATGSGDQDGSARRWQAGVALCEATPAKPESANVAGSFFFYRIPRSLCHVERHRRARTFEDGV